MRFFRIRLLRDQPHSFHIVAVCLALRDLLDLTVELRCRCLIKAYALFHIQNSDCLKQPQSPEAISIRRVFRRFERDLHMTLGGKVINLIRLRLLDDANEIGSVRHVPVVHGKAQLLLVRILIKMIDPPGVLNEDERLFRI